MPSFPSSFTETLPFATAFAAATPTINGNVRAKSRYVLYTYRYSVRSLMVQYTYAIATARNQEHSSSDASNGNAPSITIGAETMTSAKAPKRLVNGASNYPTWQPKENGVVLTNGALDHGADRVMNKARIDLDPVTIEEERKAIMEMDIREMRLDRGENCEEWFLREVNGKGQVSSASISARLNRSSCLFVRSLQLYDCEGALAGKFCERTPRPAKMRGDRFCFQN